LKARVHFVSLCRNRVQKLPHLCVLGFVIGGMTTVECRALEPRLLSVSEVLQGSSTEEHRSVRVQGTVTFSSQKLKLAFLQDETGGIAFDPRTGVPPLAKPGQVVRVEGAVISRDGIPTLVGLNSETEAPKVQLVDERIIPVTPRHFDLEDASALTTDGLLCHVTGIVRCVTSRSPPAIEISSRDGIVTAQLPWLTSLSEATEWMNQVVEMEAVMVSGAGSRSLSLGADAVMLVPARTSWKIHKNKLAPQFKAPPLTSIKALRAAASSSSRVHVQGVVTGHRAPGWINLRLKDLDVRVFSRQRITCAPGDVVSISCWPQSKGGLYVFSDGVIQKVGTAVAPTPTQLESLKGASAYNQQLVSVKGFVTHGTVSPDNPILQLAAKGNSGCDIAWHPFLSLDAVKALRAGTEINLTGILTIGISPQNIGSRATITPRTASDIVVLSSPSPVSRQVLEQALLLSVVAVIAVAIFATWTRRQLRAAKAKYREMEAGAITAEERRRIAREFHDSLQQQLTAAALHLETAKRALVSSPQLVPSLVNDASAMLRHCQVEARHCIWDLRSQTLKGERLPEAIQEWLHMRSSSAPITTLQFHQSGTLSRISDDQGLHLMRVCQEAVNNALNHAAARVIKVSLAVANGAVTLSISDDGHGFDASAAEQAKSSRFGLHGMKERATRLGGDFQITSLPDRGTTVTLTLAASTLLTAPVPSVSAAL
jgi:signal transduction histidine kinase